MMHEAVYAKDDKAILHYVDGSQQDDYNIVQVVVIKPDNRKPIVGGQDAAKLYNSLIDKDKAE